MLVVPRKMIESSLTTFLPSLNRPGPKNLVFSTIELKLGRASASEDPEKRHSTRYVLLYTFCYVANKCLTHDANARFLWMLFSLLVATT